MTLRKRVSKNVYDLDTVRMQPHPPLQIDSAAMAKHYLATYALFRVSFPAGFECSCITPLGFS